MVQQYEKMGSFDLEDRHGGRIGSESARISQEELRNKKYLVMNGMKKEGQGIDDIPASVKFQTDCKGHEKGLPLC